MKGKIRIKTGNFLERINRFTCLVEVNRKKEQAYLANSGRLEELLTPKAKVLLGPNKGKLPYKLYAIEHQGLWVSVDSHLVNHFFLKKFKERAFPFMKRWTKVSSEKRVNHSRIDFVFEDNEGNRLYCEVKSCTLQQNGVALFPDAPTLRGVRHLKILKERRLAGDSSMVVFVVQRDDVDTFAPNSLTHFDFSKSVYQAYLKGVEFYLVVTSYDIKTLTLKLNSFHKLSLMEMLVNEYHLWRYPEVHVTYEIVKTPNEYRLNFEGTTSFCCSFDENVYDFIYFAEDRGIVIKILSMEIKGGAISTLIELQN